MTTRNPREVTETSRSFLVQGMREARDKTDNPIIREAMGAEMDRIMKRWWPKEYR